MIMLKDLLRTKKLTESTSVLGSEYEKLVTALKARPDLVNLAVKTATGKDVSKTLKEAKATDKLIKKVATIMLAAGLTSGSLQASDIQSKIQQAFANLDSTEISSPEGEKQPVKFVMPPQDHAYKKAASDGAGPTYAQQTIDYSGIGDHSELVKKAMDVIKKFENSKNNPRGGYNKKYGKWFPHGSLEGGSDTIGYGHKILSGEDFSAGLTDSEVEDLLEDDINKKIRVAERFIKNFNSLPLTVRVATVNALYRGDMGPRTMALLSRQQFGDAAKEYLNHQEYRTTKLRGVRDRMNWNAEAIRRAG